jgi:hypothetical protein
MRLSRRSGKQWDQPALRNAAAKGCTQVAAQRHKVCAVRLVSPQCPHSAAKS